MNMSVRSRSPGSKHQKEFTSKWKIILYRNQLSTIQENTELAYRKACKRESSTPVAVVQGLTGSTSPDRGRCTLAFLARSNCISPIAGVAGSGRGRSET